MIDRPDEGPVFVPFSALLDPLADFFDVSYRERRAVIWLGHHHVRVGGGDPRDEFGFFGVTGDDSRVAGIADRQGLFTKHKGNAARFLHTAMAGGALAGEDRADVAVEIDLTRHRAKRRDTHRDQLTERAWEVHGRF